MPATPITVSSRATSTLGDLWSRARLADRLYVGYFLGVGALILIQRDRVEAWPLLLPLHAAGLALVAGLVANAARWPAAHGWYPLLMPLVTFPEIARLNLVLADGWRDAPLLAFEAWLFAEPPIVWLRRVTHPAVAELYQIGYLSYFLFLLTVAGTLRRRGDDAAFHGVVGASVLAYLMCYAVFLLWPMEGPAHTLRHLVLPRVEGGPFHDLVLLVQRAGVHGNAFPSAHVAGAIPSLLFAWRFVPRLAWILAPLCVLMGLGAVYDGYHYASDVVAGAVVGVVAAAIAARVTIPRRW
jgi:membrane-associated phospholipid phosphatase